MKVSVPRVSEEEDEVDEAKQEWLRNPVTNLIRESVRKNGQMQLTHLLAACSQSGDPNVRGAYEKYHGLKVMQAMLEEGK